MTVFAVSIIGALGMAVYGLGVLVGRWEQPRRLRRKQLAAPQPPPVRPLQAPPLQVHVQVRPPEPPRVWVPPAGVVPRPMAVPVGMATPLPMTVPVPPPSYARPPTPPAFVRPPTWPASQEPPPRLARGSIPPDLPPDLAMELEMELEAEPDTDPGVPVDMLRPEPVVQRGARFSVIRSSRR